MNPVFIIAEAGVNHNGSLENAKKLIDAAFKAGVDAVKFQTFKTENLVSRNTAKAEYQLKTTDKNESQYEMLKNLELDKNAHKELIAYCKKKGLLFLSTPFDLDSIDLMNALDIPILKVPSGEITNYPYLRKIGETKKEVILSTGMSNIDEIEQAIALLKKYGTSKLSLLHCNTEYPTPMSDVNLNVIHTMRERFQLPIGYSDHTVGIEVPIAAATLGAAIIEKHFTLDKNMEGPDHKASLEPSELKNMVRAIRNIELALGKKEKAPTNSERKNIQVARKSIVAKVEIKKGDIFTEGNLTTKRPGSGISPMQWENVIGKPANKNYKVDEMIKI